MYLKCQAVRLEFVDKESSAIKWGGALRSESELIKFGEYFVRANICNRSKSLNDI
jgi:hypothetical protein